MNAALNFEKTRKKAQRRDADEMETLRARKGKLNKHGRVKAKWEIV